MNKYILDAHDYKKDAELLLRDVREGFCMPCTDDRKKKHKLNYENPLSCDCTCERVEHLLRIADKILNEE